ncbi:MAG TPA: hypothetical protein VMV95_00155 [Bacillota bacterium]|nr:hypothetical protein [Bacillota bacterium]
MEQTHKTIYQKICKLMSTNGFVIFMNILRVVLVVWAILITIYLIKNIEAVKFLSYDSCKYCMEKTGAVCYLPRI